MVGGEEPGQLSRVIRYGVVGGFWLHRLRKIFAKTGLYREGHGSPRLDLVKKKPQKSLMKIYQGGNLWHRAFSISRQEKTKFQLCHLRRVGFKGHLQGRMDGKCLRSQKRFEELHAFKYLKTISRYFNSWFF